MKTFFRCAALAPLLALVAGCCANNTCSRDDLQADSLFLVLRSAATDSNGFSKAELDTVYLQRVSPTTQALVAPEVAIVRARQGSITSDLRTKLKKAGLNDTTLVISNVSPFAPTTTGGKLNAYAYRLTILDKSTKVRTSYQYYIENITLKGQYEADGCCTYYQNTKKTFQLRGIQTMPKDVTETADVPVAVYIGKLD